MQTDGVDYGTLKAPSHVSKTTPGVVQIEVAVTSHYELERIKSKLEDDRSDLPLIYNYHYGMSTLLDGWWEVSDRPAGEGGWMTTPPSPPLASSGQCLPCGETIVVSGKSLGDRTIVTVYNNMTGVIGFDCPTLRFEIDPRSRSKWHDAPQHQAAVTLHGLDNCSPRIVECDAATINDTETKRFYDTHDYYGEDDYKRLHYVRFGVDPTKFCTDHKSTWEIPQACDEIFVASSETGLLRQNCSSIPDNHPCPWGFSSSRIVRDPACVPSPPSSPSPPHQWLH